MTKKEAFNYRDKSAELEAIVAQLQDPAIQIDEATKIHAAGLKLIDELEAYLKQAEVEVRRRVAHE
ncbi:MAG TPA: exodeoxyribonuclease VII small subunit [Candidatus Saccharimonadia bacterium]|nr:exodeoxyribonuclease VII small subunit [Candidatus Saccharimonadia bacterium]